MPKKPTRRLFLDDDPLRAEVFLKTHPDATWVETVADCVAKLAEPWDEVHLDHDLGGEHFVEVDRPDCGMEVVRWLTAEAGPRPHLRRARFLIHSHHMAAAFEMALRLQSHGYRVDARPFGAEAPEPPVPLGLARLRAWVRRIRGKDLEPGAPDELP